MSNEGIIVLLILEGITALLILIVLVFSVVAIVTSNMKRDGVAIENRATFIPIQKLSEDELKKLLSEVENDLETVRIEYQGALANPYVLYKTRNLIKQRLDDTVERRQYILDEMYKRQKEAATKA